MLEQASVLTGKAVIASIHRIRIIQAPAVPGR
jgi:hypothetical protein